MHYSGLRPKTTHFEMEPSVRYLMQTPVGQSKKQLDASIGSLHSPERHYVARLHRTARFGAASPQSVTGGWRPELQVVLYAPWCVDEWTAEPLDRWHAFALVVPLTRSRLSLSPIETHASSQVVHLESSWLLVSSHAQDSTRSSPPLPRTFQREPPAGDHGPSTGA